MESEIKNYVDQEHLNSFLDLGKKYYLGRNFHTAFKAFSSALNVDYANPYVLRMAANCLYMFQDFGVSIAVHQSAISAASMQKLPPKDLAGFFVDLGVSLKAAFHMDDARRAFEQALELDPNEVGGLNNLAGMYADRSQPELALPYAERGLALAPNDPNLNWNKALALLSKHDWKKGWELHEARKIIEPKFNTRPDLDVPNWQGEPDMVVAVTAEQGIGDELMFASCIPDLIAVSKQVILESKHRSNDLLAESFGIPVYPDEKQMIAEHGDKIERKICLGSLPQFFRQKSTSFPGTPHLKAPAERVQRWRERLLACGRPPFIGVAWRGGTRENRIHERSIHSKEFLRFADLGTLVSLQYGPTAEQEARDMGIPHFPGVSDSVDMREAAALFSALDCVITVQQTNVHLAGGLGVKTFALLNPYPSWRYAGSDHRMVWYNSVHLLRKAAHTTWDDTIEAAYKEAEKFLTHRNGGLAEVLHG